MRWGKIPFGEPSQFGEGIALLYIFSRIGIANKLAVEIGAADGFRQSNTLILEQVFNFRRLMFDMVTENPAIVIEHKITAENVNNVFGEFDVPEDFDLLSIDIDGNDYWIWKALTYRPRVVVIEYNHSLGFRTSKTIKYDPNHEFKKNQYYGASARALVKLGSILGYTAIARSGTNLIFVLADLAMGANVLTLPDTGALIGQAMGWPIAPKGSVWISV